MTSLVTGRLWGPDEICPKPKQCFQFLFVSFSCNHISTLQISILLSYTLPETNIAPENVWLEDDHFLLGPGLFSGASC